LPGGLKRGSGRGPSGLRSGRLAGRPDEASGFRGCERDPSGFPLIKRRRRCGRGAARAVQTRTGCWPSGRRSGCDGGGGCRAGWMAGDVEPFGATRLAGRNAGRSRARVSDRWLFGVAGQGPAGGGRRRSRLSAGFGPKAACSVGARSARDVRNSMESSGGGGRIAAHAKSGSTSRGQRSPRGDTAV
jgi:hypothetical protein